MVGGILYIPAAIQSAVWPSDKERHPVPAVVIGGLHPPHSGVIAS